MSQQCISGFNSYIFWGVSSTLDGGDPSTDENRAFNPMLSVSIVAGEYEQKQIKTFDKLIHAIEFSSKFPEFEMTVSCYFRDPILMLAAFGYKGVTTAWSGTGDTITANFSNLNDLEKNIWIRIHAHDQSGDCNHIDLLLDGGAITNYKWNLDAGDGVIEEVTFSFTNTETNAIPADIDDGFDDGSFNQTGAAEVATIVAKAKVDISHDTYFTIQGISTTYVRTDYYVWFDVNGDDDGGPAPTGYTEIRVDISGDTSAQEVSDAITSAITAKSEFGAANGGGSSTIVTVTNANNGDVKDIADVDSGLTVATTTQGVTPVDGGWSLWDGNFESDEVLEVKDVTVTWGGNAFTGVDLKNVSFEFATPRSSWFKQSQLTTTGRYLGTVEPVTISVSGVLTAHSNVVQAYTTYGSKTTGTFQLLYNTSIYLQVTIAYIQSFEGELPEAGDPTEGTFTLKSGAAFQITYYWTGNEATDPSGHIKHTDV